MIDTTINLGALVAILISLATGIGFIYAIRESVKVLDTRLTNQDKVIAGIQNELKTLNDMVTKLAVQDVRINTLDQRLQAQGTRLDEALSWFMRERKPMTASAFAFAPPAHSNP